MQVFFHAEQMSKEKTTSLFKVYRGEKLPSYVWIIVNHYKHPYKTTSIMKSKRVFFRGSNTTTLIPGVVSPKPPSKDG